jgi:hypothetical protein
MRTAHDIVRCFPGFLIVLLPLLFPVHGLWAGQISKPASNSSRAPAGAFGPADASVAPDFLQALQAGWEGFAWGASLDRFRQRFPGHRYHAGDHLCASGEGPICFCRCRMQPLYGFNSRWQFYQVVLLPESDTGPPLEEVIEARLHLDRNPLHIWRHGPIELEINTNFQIIVITNTSLDY